MGFNSMVIAGHANRPQHGSSFSGSEPTRFESPIILTPQLCVLLLPKGRTPPVHLQKKWQTMVVVSDSENDLVHMSGAHSKCFFASSHSIFLLIVVFSSKCSLLPP